MKRNIISYISTIVLGVLLIVPKSQAQETEEFSLKNYRFYFTFETIKQIDDARLLKVSYTAKNKKDRKDILPIYEADINFYNVNDEDDILLGTAQTNKEGIAELLLEKDQILSTDDNGYINFKAVFDGSDELDYEEEELAVKDLILKFNLEEIDSIKTISVEAMSLDSLGSQTPVDDVEIKFFTKGMLSNMLIDEGYISDGSYEFEFDQSIPGDKNGNLSFVAKIVDSDDFGSVVKEQDMPWGIGQTSMVIENNNQLWSKAAPIWMYIVLTIMLVGIWANFIYTIIELNKIRKETKNVEKLDVNT